MEYQPECSIKILSTREGTDELCHQESARIPGVLPFAPVVGMYQVRTLALARAPEQNTIQTIGKTWLGVQDQIY